MSEPRPLKKEAQGDWCGFKGAAYHITYAVWLLLTGQAAEVSFYRGNDLLAQPTLPPDELNLEGCGLAVVGASTDEWIQVKAHAAAWTTSAVLVEAEIKDWSSHPDVWRAKGHLQLLLGQWEEARTSLARCFDVPVRVLAIERSAHYDLACVWARLARAEECRAQLTQAIDRGFRIERDQFVTDPDFASVRNEEWFERLADLISA